MKNIGVGEVKQEPSEDSPDLNCLVSGRGSDSVNYRRTRQNQEVQRLGHYEKARVLGGDGKSTQGKLALEIKRPRLSGLRRKLPLAHTVCGCLS